MITISVTDRQGVRAEIRGQEGWSLMEVMKENGLDEVLAICGGACACATCHVFVDDAFLAALPVQTEEESELLDSSPSRNSRSRLSCQISCSPEIDGIHVEIAPED